MKEIVRIIILLILIFAAGFIACFFLVKVGSEPIATEIPSYESEWVAEKDSLYNVIEDLRNQDPVYVKVEVEVPGKPGEPITKTETVKVYPICENYFMKHINLFPHNFKEALAVGDSIWLGVDISVLSHIGVTEADSIVAKNDANLKITNLLIKKAPRKKIPVSNFAARLSMGSMFQFEGKGFDLPLGGGIVYKPWGFGVLMKASSNKSFGFEIHKDFNL